MRTEIILDETQWRYTPDAGEVPDGVKVRCGVCRALCLERRGVMGPTGFTEAMAGRKHRHDSWSCALGDTAWHRQVEKLRNLAESTPSQSLAKLYLSDADAILKEHNQEIGEQEWR